MPELNTPRLHLRSFRDDDLEAFATLAANDGFMRFSSTGALDRAGAAALLERILVRTRAGLPSQFAVFENGGERMLGYCGFFLQEVDNAEEIEIGYRLHPDAWGRGIATEAARAVRDHAFRDLRLERVISIIHPENRASERVAEKNGLTRENFTSFRGFPVNIYALSRSDWERLPQSAAR